MLAHARKHPTLRHRELAWRMVDEDVAYLSPSTVYRILKRANLVCPWRRRTKRRRPEIERASRPDQRWSTDLMQVQVGEGVYPMLAFLDEYSRFIVHHEILLSMDGLSVSAAAQEAIEALPRGADGKPSAPPEIRSDNGSCYVSKEFRLVLTENGLSHRRIRPHCPEENGLMERANRTLREGWDGEEEPSNLLEAKAAMARIVRRYNETRLHSALGYLPPAEYYRGDPAARFEQRRRKLFQARHRRRERNLRLRQGVLVHREMEKPGSGDKVDCTFAMSAAICRLHANPERENRAASCRPPSVLAPGSALGSCRHGALSSAQAVLHRSAAGRLWQRVRRAGFTSPNDSPLARPSSVLERRPACGPAPRRWPVRDRPSCPRARRSRSRCAGGPRCNGS